MADDENKIVVEIPNTGNYSQLPQTAPSDRMTEFKRGIENAIAFPENIGDLIYDCLSMVTIPALLMSLWLQPLPSFIRFAVLLLLVVAAVGMWYLLGIPEIRGLLTFRVFLVGVGVILPLLP
ncbi:hypothetical protein IQ247_28990 [Plectonema cf. radiosum LEGE 06105]|uniref:Uncharacterized protein n=1 Tax=Plectonema cf. radiosum LEGE 06105 TaxID=945769 RepID=A0A8J7FDL9_9CYAN|nr:hypothetical protein [Plectonema radiosum]MBE9216649.1 hypothetical protein [Plectonema cf. radiosum LEGE 06105]